MEVDYPSRHPSGWMPLRDLQVKIADDNTVDFMFKQKQMASPFTISSRATIPAKFKWENNVQQGVRSSKHGQDIRRGNLKNAFVKHLTMFHPDEERPRNLQV